MPSTITEKILADHSGKKEVTPGELIEARIDLILCHEVTTPPAITMLENLGIEKVFNPDKIVVTPDHFIPNKDIRSAELAKKLRAWVKNQGIRNYYELGRHGICHALLPEQGHVLPGSLIVGADSHTCTHGALGAFSTGIGSTDLAFSLATGKLWFKVPESIKVIINGTLPERVYSKDVILKIISDLGVDGATYKVIEFQGELVKELSVEARMTLTNMAIEAGAKTGIINPDEKTIKYVRERTNKKFSLKKSDREAKYLDEKKYDFSDLDPLVALPSLPSKVKPAKELEKVKIDQAYLGSCTNGRIEDLRIAGEILKGNKINKEVRMIVVPATTGVYKKALKEGLIDLFIDSGAVVSTPTCGACLGGHMGVLAKDEKCISSTNRNFKGRMGHPNSKVFLASPATVAASAIFGYIKDPREV